MTRGDELVRGKRALLRHAIATLTHVGQLLMLRRLANAPVRSENFAAAEIVPGRVTADQAAPKFEFD